MQTMIGVQLSEKCSHPNFLHVKAHILFKKLYVILRWLKSSCADKCDHMYMFDIGLASVRLEGAKLQEKYGN